MNSLARLRLYLWISILVALIVLGVALYLRNGEYLSKSVSMSSHEMPVNTLADSGVGGEFQLETHKGAVVTDQSWPDHYKLIFFGFTYCPDICPTKLRHISEVMKKLPVDIAKKVQPLFITVDPERDTVDQLSNYVSLFDARILGLTGTRDQIDTVIDGYKVFAQRRGEANDQDYMIDHSAFTYLMNRDNELIEIFSFDTKPQAMVDALMDKVK